MRSMSRPSCLRTGRASRCSAAGAATNAARGSCARFATPRAAGSGRCCHPTITRCTKTICTSIWAEANSAAKGGAMTETRIPSRVFPDATQGAVDAEKIVHTAQTDSPSYKLAFQDNDFLLRPDLRPVRFQLELLKPELFLDEANIE